MNNHYLVWGEQQFGFHYAAEKAKLLEALNSRNWGARVYMVGNTVLRFLILSHTYSQLAGPTLDGFLADIGLDGFANYDPIANFPEVGEKAKLITVTGGPGQEWPKSLIHLADEHDALFLEK